MNQLATINQLYENLKVIGNESRKEYASRINAAFPGVINEDGVLDVYALLNRTPTPYPQSLSERNETAKNVIEKAVAKFKADMSLLSPNWLTLAFQRQAKADLIKHLLIAYASPVADNDKESVVIRQRAVREILCDVSENLQLGDFLVLNRTDRFDVRVGEVVLIDTDRGYVAYKDHTNHMEDHFYLTDPNTEVVEHYRVNSHTPLSQLLAKTDALNAAKAIGNKHVQTEPQ